MSDFVSSVQVQMWQRREMHKWNIYRVENREEELTTVPSVV